MKYILQKKEEKVYSFLLDDPGHAVEIHADSVSDGPKIGDIYIGLVQKVAKNINAAFVEIIPGMNGYLSFDEIIDPVYTLKGPSPDIQAGDQLVVQLSREAFGDKNVSLTTRIALKSRDVILTAGGVGLGVSRKIPEELRQEIKDRILSSEEFADMQKRAGQCGIVVRTSAADRRDEILKELSGLEAELIDLRLKAPYRTVYTCLKKQPPRWLTRAFEYKVKYGCGIMTDDMSLYRQMLSAQDDAQKMRLHGPDLHSAGPDQEMDAHAPAGQRGLRLYTDQQLAMEKLFSLERELSRAMDRRVNLKSGADLVIESTEALHVIDVNSGRIKNSKSKEDALLEVDLEAAAEAARQIRLRNLSGIIIIDFINLKEKKHVVRILEELRRAVSDDPVPTHVVDMTKLGLVELTRQKTEVPLSEAVKS